ncbi:MAG: type II toxin-antitoxin system HicA family toxin [Phascolarctobacterium sp.]|nr:type II toxin-antitoxin system HicA family toxin [Phascolarctobacterium sp.]
MSTLEKKLRALASGKNLPWKQVVSLLEAYGVKVIPPTGGGSHHKIVYPGKNTIIVPVHNGTIKKIYAKEIAALLEEIDKE